ncbi:MAG: chemotaxis protein CheA [Trichlorobacter sp.]|nr:chemotaxis protein CheA [Trichlorobacter sp.]
MSKAPAPSRNAALDFLAEAEEVVEDLGTRLGELSEMAEKDNWDPDLLNAIFRDAHSLKGLAGMFGFAMVSEVAHHTETLLDWLRMGKVSLTSQVMEILFASVELLTALLRATLDDTLEQHRSEAENHAKRINACLNPPAAKENSSPLQQLGLPANMTSSLTDYEEHRLQENIDKARFIHVVHASFELASFDEGLGELTATIKEHGEVISTLPSMGENMETHIDFDLLVGSKCTKEQLDAIIAGSAASITFSGKATTAGETARETLPADKPSLPDAPAAPATLEQQPLQTDTILNDKTPKAAPDELISAKSISSTVRVDIGKLDELMNIVGELVLAHSTIASITGKMRAEGFSRTAIDLGKAAKDLERRLGDLQKGVMDIRMIPVGQLYDKMTRIVRKISREQGKKIDLKLFGAETELDKLIVEDIADPLMHIIRNAVDHGIETPEKRLAAGKSERGTVRLASYQKGNHVVIEVEDDGGGIDTEKIRCKALQKGLIQENSQLSEREILELIFHPGFSTAETVTAVSGRGVGMDVVRNNIAAVSGMVDLETRLGYGSRFTIVLPITLAIIKALIVFCAGRIYAIPITSVIESIILSADQIRTVEGKEVISLREQTLPLVRLENFFRIERIGKPADEQYVVVVGVAEKRLGLVVDDLIGQQDIVIKTLGEAFKTLKGISGAADLGDQRTILVLDSGSIISELMRSNQGG